MKHSSPVRLVQVLPTPINSPGGMESVARQIASVAHTMGIATVAYGDDLDRGKPLSSRYPMLNRVATIIRVSAAVRSRLRKDDVIVSHSLYGAFLPRKRHAYVYHCTFAGQGRAMRAVVPRLDYLVCRRGYGMLDAWSGKKALPVAVSNSVAKETRLYYGVQCAVVIPNAVEAPPDRLDERRQAARARLGWADDLFVVTVIGRFEGVKGSRLILQLIPRLDDRFLLCVVAPNLREPSWTCCRALLFPQMNRAQLWEHLAAVDAVLCTSRYESFGLTIAEAWAAGRPVISTNVGIARELRHENPALDEMVVDDPDDADGLLDRLRRLRCHREFGNQQAEWGRSVVAERFSNDRFLRQYARLISELAGVDSPALLD